MTRTIARPLPRTVSAAAIDPVPGRAAVLCGVAAATNTGYSNASFSGGGGSSGY